MRNLFKRIILLMFQLPTSGLFKNRPATSSDDFCIIIKSKLHLTETDT